MKLSKPALSALFIGVVVSGLLAGIAVRHFNAPDLNLSDLAAIQNEWETLGGTPISVDEWNGKAILLNFWGSWCRPCVEEMPMLDSFNQDYQDQNFHVVGVAIDRAESALQFLETNNIQYPSLIASPVITDAVMDLFGNDNGVLPFTIVFSKTGSVVLTKAGPFTEAELEEIVSGV